MAKKKMPLDAAMSEVHHDVPKNVVATGKEGKEKEAMLRAIAFSKAGQSRKKTRRVRRPRPR